MGPKKPCAVFTIAQNEPRFLRIWLEHYSKEEVFKDSIYVLDHDSTESAHIETLREFSEPPFSVHVVPIHRSESFNHQWLRETVQQFQKFLLQSYEFVLFAEADEIVVAETGLTTFIEKALLAKNLFHKCEGYDIVHRHTEEPPLDWNKRPLLTQRSTWSPSRPSSKVLLSRIPLEWGRGFHDLEKSFLNIDREGWLMLPRLALMHLHRIDFDYCLERHIERAALSWSEEDLAKGYGAHNRLHEKDTFLEWYYHPETSGLQPLALEPLPEVMKGLV